jgi:hypothetical protein
LIRGKNATESPAETLPEKEEATTVGSTAVPANQRHALYDELVSEIRRETLGGVAMVVQEICEICGDSITSYMAMKRLVENGKQLVFCHSCWKDTASAFRGFVIEEVPAEETPCADV